MDNVVTKENIEQFKKELKVFELSKNPIAGNTPPKIDISDYLQWCQIQRMDKLIKLLEDKK